MSSYSISVSYPYFLSITLNSKKYPDNSRYHGTHKAKLNLPQPTPLTNVQTDPQIISSSTHFQNSFMGIITNKPVIFAKTFIIASVMHHNKHKYGMQRTTLPYHCPLTHSFKNTQWVPTQQNNSTIIQQMSGQLSVLFYNFRVLYIFLFYFRVLSYIFLEFSM